MKILRLLLALILTLAAPALGAPEQLTSPVIKGAPDFSAITNASTVRTQFGLAIGTDVQGYDADLTTWAGITPASGVGTFLGVPNTANLAAIVSTTGSGSLVLATGATIASPTISGSMTVGSGAALTMGIGSTLTISGALSSAPSSGSINFTNLTLSGLTSSKVATGVSDETGSGALVFGTSPTLAGPTINTGVTLGTGVPAALRTALTVRRAWGYRLASDVSVTSATTGTTLTATALTSALPAGVWLIRLNMSFAAASATPDAKFDLSYTGATVSREFSSSAAINGGALNFQGNAAYLPVSSNGPSSLDLNDVGGAWLEAVVTVASSGTVTLRFAQNVSSADAVALKAGATMTIEEVTDL